MQFHVLPFCMNATLELLHLAVPLPLSPHATLPHIIPGLATQSSSSGGNLGPGGGGGVIVASKEPYVIVFVEILYVVVARHSSGGSVIVALTRCPGLSVPSVTVLHSDCEHAS